MTHVWVVLCNYVGGSYVFSAHETRDGALRVAEAWNQEAAETRAQAKVWRENGFRDEDEPDDVELEENFYSVEWVEVKR